jgi:hypothetical protein
MMYGAVSDLIDSTRESREEVFTFIATGREIEHKTGIVGECLYN